MRETTVRANPGDEPRKITPDAKGWTAAAALPITVVVGTADTEPQPARAGHLGSTRIDYAKQWVAAMTRLHPNPKRPGGLQLILVDSVGHDSAGLTPKCQEVLAQYLKAD